MGTEIKGMCNSLVYGTVGSIPENERGPNSVPSVHPWRASDPLWSTAGYDALVSSCSRFSAVSLCPRGGMEPASAVGPD